MRSPVRVVWRTGALGTKIDECRECGRVGQHRLERQYRWLEVGPVGVLPLGLRHGMQCAHCWAWTPLPRRLLRDGVRDRSLPLPGRPRPLIAAAAAVGRRAPDLDRVLPTGAMDNGTAYLVGWAVVVAILVGLSLQPAGIEGAHEPSPTCLVVVGLKPGQPVPTPPVSVSQTLCVLPHNFEPLAQLPLDGFAPSATVPPYPIVLARVEAACDAAFRDAFGPPAPGGPVALVTGANAHDWDRGDRFAWCVAADPERDWPTSPLPR